MKKLIVDQNYHVCNAINVCPYTKCWHYNPHKDARICGCNREMKCFKLKGKLKKCVLVEILGKSENTNKLIYRFK